VGTQIEIKRKPFATTFERALEEESEKRSTINVTIQSVKELKRIQTRT
jgi:hypothetical protein